MRNLLMWGGAVLLAALPIRATAQTNWQTVVVNDSGRPFAITADGAGNVFMVGTGADPSGAWEESGLLPIQSGLVFGTTTRDETSLIPPQTCGRPEGWTSSTPTRAAIPTITGMSG
jgi:hypothetical protein